MELQLISPLDFNRIYSMKIENISSFETKDQNLEKSKEESFFEKTERLIPKKMWPIVAGLSLLVAIETTEAQEKVSLPLKSPEQNERVLDKETEKIFEEKFKFSDGPKWERFVIIEGDSETDVAGILNRLDPFYESGVSGTRGKKVHNFYTLEDNINIADPQKILDQYKVKNKKIDFKIDSVEIRKILDTEDYKKIFAGFFEKEELNKILELFDEVNIIGSPKEGKKIPVRYGFEGEEAAHFNQRKDFIEFQRYYLNHSNIKDQAETMFHELGHAFDPLSSELGSFSLVRSTIKLKNMKEKANEIEIIGLPDWTDVMKKDQEVNKDKLDTFFKYPIKIANDQLRECEDFAESFSNYFWRPLWLQEKAPNRFKSIDDLVKTYLENPNFDINERCERALRYLENRYSNEERRKEEKINEIIRNF